MGSKIALEFKTATGEEDYQKICDYSIEAFSDSPGFKWTPEGIKKEVQEGWTLEAVCADKEVIAALFFRRQKDALLTKNTAIKSSHQGSGFSHQMKEYLEQKARQLKAKKVLHYCQVDNFRAHGLNESHGYKKTGRFLKENEGIIEWEKKLK